MRTSCPAPFQVGDALAQVAITHRRIALEPTAKAQGSYSATVGPDRIEAVEFFGLFVQYNRNGRAPSCSVPVPTGLIPVECGTVIDGLVGSHGPTGTSLW